ncbi:MAG: hypothetical protein ACRYGM_22620 [Janthinobacterium lividum]
MSAMSAGTSGAGAQYRSRESIPAGILVLFWLGGGSVWLLRGWVQRRFGLEGDHALVVAALPGVLAGILVLLADLRRRPWMDTEQRLRVAAAAEPKRRRHRVWLILILCMLLVGQLADSPAGFSGVWADGESWNLVLLVFMILADGVRDFLPSRATTPGRAEPDQAERFEALRVAFLAVMILGGLAAAASMRWPEVAGRVWLAVLLGSVLAAEVRMAMLPRWTARLAGEGG